MPELPRYLSNARGVLWDAVRKEKPLSEAESKKAMKAIDQIKTTPPERMMTVYYFTGAKEEKPACEYLVNEPHFMTGNPPLTYAATNGHLGIAKALIAAKADVNYQNGVGATPINCVAQKTDNLEMVKMLLEAKANPMLKGPTMRPALEEARANSHTSVADFLAEVQQSIGEEPSSAKKLRR